MLLLAHSLSSEKLLTSSLYSIYSSSLIWCRARVRATMRIVISWRRMDSGSREDSSGRLNQLPEWPAGGSPALVVLLEFATMFATSNVQSLMMVVFSVPVVICEDEEATFNDISFLPRGWLARGKQSAHPYRGLQTATAVHCSWSATATRFDRQKVSAAFELVSRLHV